jgi:hypothetical protein
LTRMRRAMPAAPGHDHLEVAQHIEAARVRSIRR